jgi:hypothetical protein
MSHMSTEPIANRTAVKARGEMSVERQLGGGEVASPDENDQRRPRAGVVSGI